MENKPKYRRGQWVRFYLGGYLLNTKRRIMRGSISGWYTSSGGAVVYGINRNKQTYRDIYESDIIGIDKSQD